MKTWKKVLIGAGAVSAALIVVGIAVHESNKGVVTVQTGRAQRQDLASMLSASGEIRPKTYVNIGANAFGKITHLYVREGDRVKKGQMLAQLENVQSTADVAANKASWDASTPDAVAAGANLNPAKADLNRAKADSERPRLDWDRAEGLFKVGV